MTIKEAFEKLTATCSAGMKNPFFIMRNLHDAFADIAGKIEGGGSEVEVTQVVTSGTKIATIKVDDDSTDLYAPKNEIAYSSTEHKIGTWIDGSDVYEKSYSITSLSFVNNAAVIDSSLSSSNCTIVEYNGGAYTSSGAGVSLCGIPAIATWEVGIHLSDELVLFAGGNGAAANFTGGSVLCTVRYLKKSSN